MKVAEIRPCLCPKEVADVLGVSERTALRLMAGGEIASFRVRTRWRTTIEKLEEYQAKGFARYRRASVA